MNLFDVFYYLEKNEELNLSRMLILLGVFAGKNNRSINGITKVVKLDFLLRYPLYLDRALKAKGKDSGKIELKEYEKLSVESKMIRYKYGPWDPKYHKYFNILAAKGILTIFLQKRTVKINLTDKGLKIYRILSEQGIYQDYEKRSRILKMNFNQSGRVLTDFIYDNFPEIVSLNMGEIIE